MALPSHVLLSTAYVDVCDGRGAYQSLRCLIDSGSMTCFITEKAVRRLNLRKVPDSVEVRGLGSMNTKLSGGSVSLSLKPPDVNLGVTFLEEIYDDLFPGASSYDREYDSYELELTPSNVKPANLSVRFDNILKPRTAAMVPLLRTAIQQPVTTTPRTVLTAFYDRNSDVPDYRGIVDESGLIDSVFDAFERFAVADQIMYSQFKNSSIKVNPLDMEAWLNKQSTGVERILQEEDNLLMHKALNEYTYILKRNAKIVLNSSAPQEIKSPQAIAYLDKLYNAVFSPIFLNIRDRLVKVLRPNLIVYTELDIEQLTKSFTRCVRPSQLGSEYLHTFELDISKYDKSQWHLMLNMEVRLMLNFGVPEETVAMWVVMHSITRLRERKTGMSATVTDQRKSGDPATYDLNTFVLLLIMCYLFGEDLSETVLLIGGDDMYAVLKKRFASTDALEKLASLFNLEDDTWVALPDPVKLLIKLGRRDMVDRKHVEDYRISLKDLIAHYNDEVISEEMEFHVRDRYQKQLNYKCLANTIFAIVHNKDEFHSLYREDSFYSGSYVGSRPSLDI
ncbi:uncharacterized protein LOC123686594 [Harmonia axyridis]|uniref:uncharacterized protein LOC123686594 n=1 Tax=Harmonia axyridis TaxID=115357 RepID=UPI001E277499|nr:uncharacterized protein LOC123686594 [Harmonia axyridis]